VEDVDRLRAAAETRLDQVDAESERAEEDVPDPASTPSGPDVGVDAGDYGIHVDDPEADLLDEDLDAGLRDDRGADLLDALGETFNARDLDGLLELVAPDAEAPGLLGYDVANLPDAVEDLWQRRPTCLLTRGLSDGQHVGVLWEHDGSAWWRAAVLHVEAASEGRAGVLEFTDDAALLERVTSEPPDPDDVAEGTRWHEWEDGVDDDG
jgi:hypothetical protein